MYDLLKEKWITVKDFDGKVFDVSLKDAILHAHEYKELCEENVIQEFSVYRFLATFVSDMLSDELDDILGLIEYREKVLLKSGKFDENTFNQYIDVCKEDGASFDLFDSERPFLQNNKIEYKESQIRSVASLDCRNSSGTNKLFHSHSPETESALKPSDVAKLLLAQSAYALPGGGYTSTNYGAYTPIFIMIRGNSLFETIAYNLFINEKNIETKYDKPMWRTDLTGVNVDLPATGFSKFALMNLPYRFIKVIEENDGMVRKICFGHGFKGSKEYVSIAKDPFVSYLMKKNEESVYCAKSADTAWKEITGILGSLSRPEVVRTYQIDGKLKDKRLPLMAYVIVVKDVHGTIDGVWKSMLDFPIQDTESANELIKRIDNSIDVSKIIIKKVKKATKSALGSNDAAPINASIEKEYNSKCRHVFFTEYLPAMFGNQDDAYEMWKGKIFGIAISCYKKYVVEKAGNFESTRKAYAELQKIIYEDSVKKKTQQETT